MGPDRNRTLGGGEYLTNGRDGGDNLSQLQLIKDGSFTSSILEIFQKLRISLGHPCNHIRGIPSNVHIAAKSFVHPVSYYAGAPAKG